MAGLGRRSHYRKHLTDAVLHDLPEPDFSKGERIAKVVGTRGSNQFEIVVSLAPNNIADDDIAPSLPKAGGEITKTTPSNTSSRQHTPQLAILPTKFRKLVWVKRNDFVIVQSAQEEDEENKTEKATSESSSSNNGNTVGDISGGIRYLITHILYKDQVKHLVQKKIWPLDDPFFDTENMNANKGYSTTDFSSQDQRPRNGEGDEHASLSNDDASSGIEGEEEYGVDDNDDGIVYGHDAYDDDYFVNTNRIAKLDIQDSSDDESSDDDDC